MFGLTFMGNIPIKEMVEHVKFAEEKGFDFFWMAEEHFYRDAITPCAVLASVTKRIKIGPGIISVWTRDPVTIAMSMATIDELSNQRVNIGLGCSVKSRMEGMLGMKFVKPLERMRAYTTVIRQLLACKTVDYQSEILNIKNVQLSFKPVRSHIPIYIGATGPRMLQLAGEIGDGAFLNIFCSPEYVRDAIEQIKIGAEKIDKDYSKIDIPAFITFSVHEDPKIAKQYPKPLIALYCCYPELHSILKYGGLNPKGNQIKKIIETVKNGDITEAVKHIPDSTVDALTASGTPQDCRKRIRKYIESGVKTPVIYPVSPDIRLAIETAIS